MVASVCERFLGNRPLEECPPQAYVLHGEELTPCHVDRAMQAEGMAMGSSAVMDLADDDNGRAIRAHLTVAV